MTEFCKIQPVCWIIFNFNTKEVREIMIFSIFLGVSYESGEQVTQKDVFGLKNLL